jgi:hypothetical protein
MQSGGLCKSYFNEGETAYRGDKNVNLTANDLYNICVGLHAWEISETGHSIHKCQQVSTVNIFCAEFFD